MGKKFLVPQLMTWTEPTTHRLRYMTFFLSVACPAMIHLGPSQPPSNARSGEAPSEEQDLLMIFCFFFCFFMFSWKAQPNCRTLNPSPLTWDARPSAGSQTLYDALRLFISYCRPVGCGHSASLEAKPQTGNSCHKQLLCRNCLKVLRFTCSRVLLLVGHLS